MKRRLVADAAVLGVLAPGGLLTTAQITTQAQLTSWAARRAISRLSHRGLIMPTPCRARWSITPCGEAELTGKRLG
jgi:hypothetical protein